MSVSSYEKEIIRILNKEEILFEKEKSFIDLHKGLYRFDFYLPLQKIIIECHGEQHYTFNKKFYKNKSDFTKAQERDRRKISYCLAHNIPIYAIPYWEIDSLKTFSDLTQEKFRAHTKFHNDIVYSKKID